MTGRRAAAFIWGLSESLRVTTPHFEIDDGLAEFPGGSPSGSMAGADSVENV